jgi:hypothetical protein
VGPFNVCRVGATRRGKSEATAVDVARSRESTVLADPHKRSTAERVLTHASGNVLYERLSDVRATLRYDMLSASRDPDAPARQMADQRRAEGFVDILLRRRGGESMAGTPLMEEWVLALLMLFLFQAVPKPLTVLPFGLRPGTPEFEALVRDCTLDDVRFKFQQLSRLSYRALRAEVGSAARLLDGLFRSVAFTARCTGGFDLGAFLQENGILILERGEDIGDDALRVIVGAIVQLVVDHCKRRPRPHPPVRVILDEATNARLVGRTELRGIAETSKNGLYWTFVVQNLDFPDPEAVLQNCLRHEWFGCPNYELARKAAVDVLAGLRSDGRSRAERLEELTADVMSLGPGWRWVRDPEGSRKEYVPMLEPPWPAWLQDLKLEEKLCRIYARPEYRRSTTSGTPPTGDGGTPPSSPSSPPSPSPPPSSPPSSPGSSPAERFKRGRKPPGGSAGSGGGGGSA